MPDSKNPCPSTIAKTPHCEKECNKEYTKKTYSEDLKKGSSAYSVRTAKNIMNDIYTHGPVEGSFTVYEDFMTYKGGVYEHTSGHSLGGHAIKILGWGVESGVPYWLCANSWNTNWGEKGFFRIRRGSNECGIEASVAAGLP